jgi:oligopeptide/dipeptide ABC transporter ATP-binding protein
VILFEGVTVRYGDGLPAVLTDVTLEVPDGELCLVLGPSGAGKSTLLGLVNGHVPHATGGRLSGVVSVGGRDTADHRPRDMADAVGVVGQDPLAGFVADVVEDELAYGMEQLGLPPATMRKRVEEVLDLLGIAPLRRRSLRTLSGGEQQRVAIAATLAAHPQVLVLDEPTSALDVTVQARILSLFARLREERRLAYLLISHNLAVVERLCDETAVLYLGRIVERGPTGELLARPAHPYTHALRSAVPELDLEPRAARVIVPSVPANAADPPPGCVFHPRCPLAQDVCRTDVPELREVAAGRLAACHFAEQVLAGEADPAAPGERQLRRQG